MGTGAEVRICLKENITYRCFHHCNGYYSGIGTQLWEFLRRLTDANWETLEERLRKKVKWVHERDLHENDEDLQKYGRKYCDVSATEPELIKSILGKVVLCPGYALNEILKDELGHMVHISTKSDPGNDEIFQNAEYSYLINFPTKKLLVHTKKEVSVHTRKEKDLWVNVPLLNDTDWNVLSEFGIFDKNKASRTLGLVERGPEWMVRFDKEPLVKRLR